MSEATVGTTETPVDPELKEKQDKAAADTAAMVDTFASYTLDQLVDYAAENKIGDAPFSKDPNVTNETWLRRKICQAEQKKIYEGYGLTETPKMKDRRKATDKGPDKIDEAADKGKPGRKRMNKGGMYKLALGPDGNTGRPNSVKSGILQMLKKNHGDGEFNWEQYHTAVVEAMGWNAELKSFAVDTKFPDVDTAANAWFSEFINKNKMIVRTDAAA